MGYIIKVSRNKQILSILNSSETRCSFGLDNRGIPELTSWDAPKFLTLINLEQKEPHVIDLIVYASELMNNIDQALIEGSTHSFPRYIKIKCRDMQF